MLQRCTAPFTMIGLLAIGMSAWLFSADSAPVATTKSLTFTLPDPLNNTNVSVSEFKDKKAIVVLFLGTECPINNAYMPRLAEPWFLKFEADCHFRIVMSPEDLGRAGLEELGRKWGG